jgi:hypothetical protein
MATRRVRASVLGSADQHPIATFALGRCLSSPLRFFMGVLWRPSNPVYRNLIRRFDDAARTGVEVVLIGAETAVDLVTAFTTMKNSK